jgi:hypothetical protein
MTNANVANRVTLLCGFTSDASTSTPVDTMSSAPTYGGTPGTLVDSVFTPSGSYNVSDECYSVVAPATGSNTASFTSYGSASIYHSVHAITLDDVNQTTPIRSTGANGVNNVTGDTKSVSLVLRSTEWRYCCFIFRALLSPAVTFRVSRRMDQ